MDPGRETSATFCLDGRGLGLVMYLIPSQIYTFDFLNSNHHRKYSKLL